MVYKRLGSAYESGRRTGAWLKHKYRRHELLAVTAWTPGDGKPDAIYLARLDGHGNASRAGSVQLGLGLQERERLRAALAERQLPAPSRKRVRRVTPGIQVVVDLHGSPSGPARDPVLREVVVDAEHAAG